MMKKGQDTVKQENPDEVIYCIGCGAQLQSQDPNQPGYLPQSALEGRSEDDLYCKRCFRLRHYNELADVQVTSDDFLNMLGEISQEEALVVNVVDILDVNGSFVPGIGRLTGNNPLIIVGNKFDLLPKSLKRGKLRQWLEEVSYDMGVKPLAVDLISAVRQGSVAHLLDLINAYRGDRDVYIVGTTNVGKSTLINQIINLASQEEDVVTTSYFPGTTLGKIEIPLDDGHKLVDTPGIFRPGQVVHQLNPQEVKTVIPRKELKPRTYQLNPGQSLFIGGLGRFDYVQGPGKASIVVYAAPSLSIHRTKREKADDLYQSQLGKDLTPPFDSKDKKTLTKRTFKVDQASDLVYSGLGWVKINASGVEVEGHIIQGADIFIRKPMI